MASSRIWRTLNKQRTGYAMKDFVVDEKSSGRASNCLIKWNPVSLVVGNFTTLTAPGAVLTLNVILPVARQAPDLPVL
jgi:hypothetical protein